MSIIPLRKSRAPAYVAGFEDFDRLFDGLFRNALTNMATPGTGLTDLSIRLDVSESEKAYFISTDLPGVDEKDIEVTLNDGVLTIAGEKKKETEEGEKTWHRVERSYGSFRRALTLPTDADENGISARMRNGVLEIEVTRLKAPEKTTRRIAITHK